MGRVPLPRHGKTMWHLFDATNQVVGRLANRISYLLQGNHKPTYNGCTDDGDHVVVVNAEKVVFTGKKWKGKNYYHHTGYPGGLVTMPAFRLLQREPTAILRKAVRGMLPSNKLRARRMHRLKLYVGPQHEEYKVFPGLVVKRMDEDGNVQTIAEPVAQRNRDKRFVALPSYASTVAPRLLNPPALEKDAPPYPAPRSSYARPPNLQLVKPLTGTQKTALRRAGGFLATPAEAAMIAAHSAGATVVALPPSNAPSST